VTFSAFENGLDYIRKEGASRKYLTYEYLNERGLDEVDLIVAAVFASSEEKISCHKLLVQIVSLLLLYLSPAETFCVVKELIRSSRDLLSSEEMRNLIRWHLPLGEEDCTRMHQSFGYSYLMTTIRKKRSLIDHMKSINFDLTNYSALAFDSLMTEFLPLHIATDFLIMFLVEGIKVVFRYAYAVLKAHKHFIKTVCNDSESLLDLLAAESRTKSQAD